MRTPPAGWQPARHSGSGTWHWNPTFGTNGPQPNLWVPTVGWWSALRTASPRAGHTLGIPHRTERFPLRSVYENGAIRDPADDHAAFVAQDLSLIASKPDHQAATAVNVGNVLVRDNRELVQIWRGVLSHEWAPTPLCTRARLRRCLPSQALGLYKCAHPADRATLVRLISFSRSRALMFAIRSRCS